MNSTHYEDFCSRMKNYRKRLGYNQTEMGKKLGISQDDYSKRENGHIIVSFNNMKSLHENGIDIDELVCGKSSNVSTEELDIVMSEYDDSTRPFAMKIIAESIMHYRHLEIMSGRQVTDEDRLLDYMLKQWDEFTMLEYVRTVMHYSQDTMSSKLYVTRKSIVNMRKRLYIQMQIPSLICITYITTAHQCILICMTEDIMLCREYGWNSMTSRRIRL